MLCYHDPLSYCNIQVRVMDLRFHVKLLDFVILYYHRRLVLKCLMQIVQVFRFVYDGYLYSCGVLKDASFMGKSRFRRATLSCDSSYCMCKMSVFS